MIVVARPQPAPRVAPVQAVQMVRPDTGDTSVARLWGPSLGRAVVTHAGVGVAAAGSRERALETCYDVGDAFAREGLRRVMM